MTNEITMTNAVIEYPEPQGDQVLRPCRNLERRPNTRTGANRHHGADILPLADLALHRRTLA